MNNENTPSNTDLAMNFNDHSHEASTVTALKVPDNERIKISSDLFGFFFPMRLEPAIYYFSENLSEDYEGGLWQFYTLSNGGFYMAPEQDDPFKVSAINGFEGELSADALGLTACLYAYSHLSFGEGKFAEICAEHYHLLLDFACEHKEAGLILRAID